MNAKAAKIKKISIRIIMITLLLYIVYIASFFLIHKATIDQNNTPLISNFGKYLYEKKWYANYPDLTCKINDWKDSYYYKASECVYVGINFFDFSSLKTVFNFLGLEFYAVSIHETLDDETNIKSQLKQFLHEQNGKHGILFKVECSLNTGYIIKCPGRYPFCSMNNYSLSLY